MARQFDGAEHPAWYRIRLSRDQYEGGEVGVIQGAFRACYIAGNGPRGMAMLGAFEREEGGVYSVYFTPPSLPHVRALVRAYSAEPDAAPARRGLTLIYGDPSEVGLAFREF
jgi:hypothetical protein